MAFAILINTLILATLSLYQQPVGDVVRVESWKKGDNRVQEQTLNIQLTFESQKYVVKVKPASGRPKQAVRSVREPTAVDVKPGYKLEIQPLRVGEGSHTEITAVTMELYEHKNLFRRLFFREQHRLFLRMKGGLMHPLTTQDFAGDFDPLCEDSIVGKENIYRIKCLSPPFLTKRAIRVEDFYCIIQVSDYTLTGSRKALQSISFRVEFVNR